MYIASFSLQLYLSSHITSPRNCLPMTSIYSLYTPSLLFLKYVNIMYILTLMQVFQICTSKCNTLRCLTNSSMILIRRFMEASILIYITTINILLIIICNCILLNPGPGANHGE